MNKSAHSALEFDKILSMLSERCVTDAARKAALEIHPITNLSILDNTLRETSDAAQIVEKYGIPPIAVTDGVESMLRTAHIEGLLSETELCFLQRFSAACRRMTDYLKKAELLRLELALNSRAFGPTYDLEDEIASAIHGERVSDNASPALADARRRIERCTLQLRERLSMMLRSHPEYYADSYVSERNGRPTLPVKIQYLRNVPGTIVDRSRTGSTVFVEPNVASKLRDELEQAVLDEENEVRRVLYALTALVDDSADIIRANAQLMERLDIIFARGRLGLDMGGVIPEFTETRRIAISQGRHPLLDREKAVPLDILLESPFSGVVITGPNTGGKTVALKTVGLFALMAQSGLMLPAKSVQICPFDNVLSDVGDGQSISENLSTFSAHIKSVMDILERMSPNSLILMDELGSGTDPAEGMGLAIAVLEELVKCGAIFLVTTHYPEIKEFARSCECILNARMKFDPVSLRPLYALEAGEAGESCALLIAERLGMNKSVIARAQRAVNGEITCSVRNTNVAHARFARYEPPKALSEHAARFGRGDSVRIYPEGKTGIVVSPSDETGNILVQTPSGKRYVNHKRLKLLVKAEMLYPDDYDFSVVFDSVSNRKARHKMTKRHVEGLIAEEEPLKP